MTSKTNNSSVLLAETVARLERAEEELRLMRTGMAAAAAEDKISANSFLTAINHDIRTHMNGVIGMIELLQQTPLSPQQYGFAESAKNSGLELIRLLSDTLKTDELQTEQPSFDQSPSISKPLPGRPASEQRCVAPAPGKSQPKDIRILLAEDDPSARKIVPRLLKGYGYRVDVAGDGREALLALEKNDYALVLMDCMMPEMNGYEITALIRDPASNVRRHDIPVIALSGNVMTWDLARCIAAGMDDHLAKPLVLDDLLAKLDAWTTV
ncbi:MAG: response regulator [Desulfuromonadaceae bacterium]|nr:response regulator [Desulfuromonadaceae bacterium]